MLDQYTYVCGTSSCACVRVCVRVQVITYMTQKMSGEDFFQPVVVKGVYEAINGVWVCVPVCVFLCV